jgi:hypothetical protein
MAVSPLEDAAYEVESESGATYVVDLVDRSCSCPDHRIRGETCKHMRRVAIEVSTRRVPPPGERRANCAACGVETFVSEADHREASDGSGETASSEADPALCDTCRLEPSDVVRDRETDDRLVVARVTADRADEVEIAAAGTTVADYGTNEGYPDDDLVVEAAYLGDVGAENPRLYSFPLSRLERVDDAAVVDAALPCPDAPHAGPNA